MLDPWSINGGQPSLDLTLIKKLALNHRELLIARRIIKL
jgi:hypothetical protein